MFDIPIKQKIRRPAGRVPDDVWSQAAVKRCDAAFARVDVGE